MLLYAQRSKTNAEEWRNWEYDSDGSWRDTGVMPLWIESTRYRRKPEPPEPRTLYAVIDVQFDKVIYYADEDDAHNALHYLRNDARVEKYVQVLE